MKNKNKLLPIALASTVLILLILISIFSLASASYDENNSITVIETYTTSNGSGQNAPTVYGEQIVWQYNNTGNGSPGNFNVYETNISNSNEAQIIANESNEWLPIIYNDTIIWNNWFRDFFNKSNQMCPPNNISDNNTVPDNWFNNSIEISNDRIMSDDWFNDTINDNFNMNAFNAFNITSQGADFTASPTSGKAPLSVSFTDKSTGSPTEWKWSFGDGTNSSEKNPIHTYNDPGQYTVTLVNKNANRISTKTVFGYIIVS